MRDTKADWRLTAHLEGFLKAHPDKGKTEEEKLEARAHYKPGDNVIPSLPISIARDNTDSEDERLLADVRERSMADVDPETARRRAERRRQSQQQRQRWTEHERQQDTDGGRQVEHQPSLRSLLSGEEIQEEILQSIYSEGLLDGIDLDHLTTAQEEELTERIAEAYRRRQRNRDRSRHRERDRDRDRERPNESTGRTSAEPATPPASATTIPTGNPSTAPAPSPSLSTPPAPRARPPISRPHLFEQASNPSQTRVVAHRRRSGSASGQQRSTRQVDRSTTDVSDYAVTDDDDNSRRQAHRPRHRAASGSTTIRSSTNPEGLRESARHARTDSANLRVDAAGSILSPRARSHDPPPSTRDAPRRPLSGAAVPPAGRGPSGNGSTDTNISSNRMNERGANISTPGPSERSTSTLLHPNAAAVVSSSPPANPTSTNIPSTPGHANSASSSSSNAIRPVVSHSAFAPEPVILPGSTEGGTESTVTNSSMVIPTTSPVRSVPMPAVSCARCSAPNIGFQLHYHCNKCPAPASGDGGAQDSSARGYDICHSCYLAGKGCLHWFGFGFLAEERWHRSLATKTGAAATAANADPPHVLYARKWIEPQAQTTSGPLQTTPLLDGAFCNSCTSHVPADACYWYCELCLSGAWGFCHACVLRGRHCTHPLLPLRRLPMSPGPNLADSNNSQRHTSNNGGTGGLSSLITTASAQVATAGGRRLPPSVPVPHLPPGSYAHYFDPGSAAPISSVGGNPNAINRLPPIIPAPPQIDCDLCSLPIPAAAPRFHCYRCSDGDYDICAPCYRALFSGDDRNGTHTTAYPPSPPLNRSLAPTYANANTRRNKLLPADGEAGWRRCPTHRHRMAVVAHDSAGRRVVVREMVGGWRWKDPAEDVNASADKQRGTGANDSTSLEGQYPPPELLNGCPGSSAKSAARRGGGAGRGGMRVVAAWSYFPDPATAPDELAFPRNAEVLEVEHLNEDWSVGVYAGKIGVFPKNHTREL